MKWRTWVEAGTSPTIGVDGTIYAGWSKLYAVNPDGSVKWMYDTGGYIQGSTPCTSADGTIYFGTRVNIIYGYLVALNPNGTELWKTFIGECESAPAIAEDGTIYIGGVDNNNSKSYLYAFGKGPLKAEANGPQYGFISQPVQFTGSATGGYKPYAWHWDFGDDQTSVEQNPTHIYTNAGNYTVTLNVTDNTSNTSSDTTWAWIQTTNTPPNTPTINGPVNGKTGIIYNYDFLSSDPDGTSIWYYVDWGDGSNTGWIGQYNSGQQITLGHRWSSKGNYIISCKTKDPYNADSNLGTITVTMPRNRLLNKPFFNFLENHPLLFQLLQRLLNF
jgi:PKD repeat protein